MALPSLRYLEEQSAIETWRALCAAHSDRAGYWRRLGIVQFAFHRPGGLNTFQHAVALVRVAQNPIASKKPPLTGSRIEGAEADAKPPLTADQENALWQALYGAQPLSDAQVGIYRDQLAKLKLGWFENLADEQLYTRAHQLDRASEAHTAALASADMVMALDSLRVGTLLIGLLGLIGLYIRRLVLHRPFVTARIPDQLGPVTRKTAFVAYLLTMTFIALPLRPLRYLVTNWSSEAVARFSTLLNLVIYIPVVLIPFWVLYTLMRRRKAGVLDGKAVTWRALLAQLGFRTRGATGDMGAGIAGYLLITPLFLMAAVLSNHLFRHFQTPVNSGGNGYDDAPFATWTKFCFC